MHSTISMGQVGLAFSRRQQCLFIGIRKPCKVYSVTVTSMFSLCHRVSFCDSELYKVSGSQVAEMSTTYLQYTHTHVQ